MLLSIGQKAEGAGAKARLSYGLYWGFYRKIQARQGKQFRIGKFE